MYRTIIFTLLFPLSLSGQITNLSGGIFDENKEPLPYATAVLLNPADSTLQFFGISNTDGRFLIRNVRKGSYLLQVAFLGYETYYKPVNIDKTTSGIGNIIMRNKAMNLNEVEVVDNHIPIVIKPDTIEFNAQAFSLKQDAVVEDLLKKLPGVEVDRSGNIKAMGENVNEVLVDGKEFFGTDPKVATKNLPAEALQKVQVFDKTSDEADFSGIDDGVREKSLNLVLKDDKKNGVFGDMLAGYGTDNHYQANAKAYHFGNNIQIAALGMINNINQFGFSFNDYLNFSGGISSLMSGSGTITIGGDDGLPINYGQPTTGLTTSGAAGLNFSYSKNKHNRLFFSYLMSGSKKNLDETTKTWNFTPQGDYYQQETSDEIPENFTHRANFGLRKRIDSTQNIIINSNISYISNKLPAISYTESLYQDTVINTLSRESNTTSDRITANLKASYQKILNSGKTVLKVSGNGSFSKINSCQNFENFTEYFIPPTTSVERQFRDDEQWQQDYNLATSLNQKLIGRIYVKPSISGGQTYGELNREQGIPAPSDVIIDSLSPDFTQTNNHLNPEVNFSRNTKNINLSLSVGAEIGLLKNSLNNDNAVSQYYNAFISRFNFSYDYKTGRKISLYYASGIEMPGLIQSLDVVDNLNPLLLVYGNRNLVPEKPHNIYFSWLIFDQFSSTTVFTYLSGTYTKDKIGWARDVNQQLVQTIVYENVKDDYLATGAVDFSTDIPSLGMKIRAGLSEAYHRGLNTINQVENISTSFTHKLSLGIENRKKSKFDIATGAKAELTNALYSVQEDLNNRYFDLSWYADLRYFPNKSWNFELSADITNYTSQNFDEPVTIPLLGAEISYYFLKNKRAALILHAYDILNKNTGIFRTSDINYQMERVTNMLGRYVMLSFKYRLNKISKNDAVTIEVNNR